MLLQETFDTAEHAKSYYAASANWETNYPELEGDYDVDVVIVGGGFSGVSTAVELCERGYRVALVEANHISWGASGRNGGQLFGGLCNYTASEPRSIQAMRRPRLLKLYPQLAGKRIDYEWGGKVGIVVNRVPLIGRASKNVFYSVGYCGHGVNVTHMASEIMTEAVTGTFERMDLFEKVKHVPLPLGNKLGNYLLALGMLYYRLLDLR